MTEKLEPGDWCADYPIRKPTSILCYQVRSIDGRYVKLNALHIVTKDRFACSSFIEELALIRKKDGRVITPPVRCER